MIDGDNTKFWWVMIDGDKFWCPKKSRFENLGLKSGIQFNTVKLFNDLNLKVALCLTFSTRHA